MSASSTTPAQESGSGEEQLAQERQPAASADDEQERPRQEGVASLDACRDQAWELFARAFVHEARSPLNALVLFAELASNHAAEAVEHEGPNLTYLLAKVRDQVTRMSELLVAFGVLWAPRIDEPTDLAQIGRVVHRFARHEALRRGVDIRASICANAPIDADAKLVVQGLVLLLSAAVAQERGSTIDFRVEAEESQALLSLETAVDGLSFEPALRALTQAGAQVEASARLVRARFVKLPPAPVRESVEE